MMVLFMIVSIFLVGCATSRDVETSSKEESLTSRSFFGLNDRISFSLVSSCYEVGHQILFSNTTEDLFTEVIWEFGDGLGETVCITPPFEDTCESSVTHAYREPGQYTVRLVVKFKNGTVESLEEKVEIGSLTVEPKVDFDIVPEGGNRPGQIVSMVSRCEPVGGDFWDKIVWDFGDGSGDVEMDSSYMTHVYDEPGDYRVILMVYSEVLGLLRSVEKQVIIS